MIAATIPKTTSLVETWRKPVSFLFAALGLSIAVFTVPRGFNKNWHIAMELVGVLLLIFAALGRIWSLAYIAGRKNRELCRLGPYSLMRNPLYFFSFLGVVGFTLALQSPLLMVFTAAAFLIYYQAVIRSEERRLRKLHGQEFDDYCAGIPRFFPRLARPIRGETLELHLAPFIRGLREVFWFLAAIILAEVLEWAHANEIWGVITLPF
jgi:protein-S-isoprenylcysteine O-methyltransferase Ste14